MAKFDRELEDYVTEKRSILIGVAENELAKLPTSIETCFQHGARHLIGSDIGYIASYFVHVGSMYARIEQDYACATKHFARVHDVLPFLDGALARLNQSVELHNPPAPNEIFESRDLQWLMIGCILAGDAKRAEDAASLLLHQRVQDRSHVYPYERFLAAMIIQDEIAAARLVDGSDIPLFQSLNEVVRAIHLRDQALFDSAIAERLVAYAKRARSHTYEEHGCTKLGNHSTIDSFGIAFCQVAMSQGLSVQVESPYLPKMFLHALWQSGNQSCAPNAV